MWGREEYSSFQDPESEKHHCVQMHVKNLKKFRKDHFRFDYKFGKNLL